MHVALLPEGGSAAQTGSQAFAVAGQAANVKVIGVAEVTSVQHQHIQSWCSPNKMHGICRVQLQLRKPETLWICRN